MSEYLNNPYDLLQIRKFKFFYSFGITIFCFLFLYIFEPFGLFNLSGLYKLTIISLYVFTGLFISLIHLFWLQNLIIKKYTLKNTILWIGWITLLSGISSSIINDIAFNHGHFSLLSFIVFTGIVSACIIIPIAILIMGHYAYMLKKQIKVTNQVNRNILKKDTITDSSEIITVEAGNRKDNITLPLENLLYIASADNYIDVYYLAGNTIKHNLLRNTLNNTEKQIAGIQDIKRCHNSYIVNISIVESISGNASGYKIKLKNCDFLIPISLKYKKDIFELLNH